MNVHVDLYMHLHAQRTLRVDDVLVLRFHLLLELHNNELRTYFADQLRKLSLILIIILVAYSVCDMYVIQLTHMSAHFVLHREVLVHQRARWVLVLQTTEVLEFPVPKIQHLSREILRSSVNSCLYFYFIVYNSSNLYIFIFKDVIAVDNDTDNTDVPC
jgi:hypothetical protein